MDTIKIDATDRSPEIEFKFDDNSFLIKGESYPEDVTAFYGPLIGQLEEYLTGIHGASVHFTFELIYFNSSTAKVLMGLFDALDETAKNSNDVLVTWIYQEGDDNMEEMGEEFGEDLKNAKFYKKAIEAR